MFERPKHRQVHFRSFRVFRGRNENNESVCVLFKFCGRKEYNQQQRNYDTNLIDGLGGYSPTDSTDNTDKTGAYFVERTRISRIKRIGLTP